MGVIRLERTFLFEHTFCLIPFTDAFKQGQLKMTFFPYQSSCPLASLEALPSKLSVVNLVNSWFVLIGMSSRLL